MGDTEPSVSPVVINVGGEGEVPGAVNVNGKWLGDPAWRSAREGNPSLRELKDEGHIFVLADMDSLPFGDASVDVVYTNNVCIDAVAFLGPCPTSAEIHRILKPSGVWIHDGEVQP